ncbi:CoA transferase [Bradyrhizobium sp. Leo121]|uniref:CoA transferase n=1 Tax=Bradyrhizobium sp. Leo121 TaxID=1571195 RepID=UPI0013EEF7EB|nr:CoA transferase [Bradyrhizobium sp. Leo121]
MSAGHKVVSLADAIGLIRDADCVALGGHAGRRPPMALVCEIIRQGRKDLRLVSWDKSLALELLVAASCGASIAANDMETRDRIRAIALGLPFTSGTWDSHFRTLRPDFVLLHAQWADADGNVRFALDQWEPELPDLLLAKTATKVIVSVEQVVSRQAIARRPTDPFLSGEAVACIVEAPYGAYPAACDTRYEADHAAVGEIAEATRSDQALRVWLDTHVFKPGDHWAAIDAVGSRRLLGITTNRVLRV